MNPLFKINEERKPSDIQGRYVAWNWFEIGRGERLLWTDEVYDRLALSMYDRVHRRGGLAHIAGNIADDSPLHPSRLVDTMIRELMREDDSDFMAVEASLVGAVRTDGFADAIFRSLEDKRVSMIGTYEGVGKRNTVIFNWQTGAVQVYAEDMR
jgi:hypothetical protein